MDRSNFRSASSHVTADFFVAGFHALNRSHLQHHQVVRRHRPTFLCKIYRTYYLVKLDERVYGESERTKKRFR